MILDLRNICYEVEVENETKEILKNANQADVSSNYPHDHLPPIASGPDEKKICIDLYVQG